MLWHRWGLLVKRSQALRAALKSHTPSKPLRSVKILPFEGDKEAEVATAAGADSVVAERALVDEARAASAAQPTVLWANILA